MRPDNTRRGVLVLGRSQRVLDDALVGLRDLGYTAHATTDFADITDRYDLEQIEMVVFGGQVPPQREAELKQQIGTINPQCIFVEGLGGIPGLIVNQVHSEFTAEHRDPTRAPTYTPGERTIQLNLPNPAEVKVTLWWATALVPPDPKSDSLIMIDERLVAGEQAIQIPDHIPSQHAFATVQADQAIYNFSIATEQ